MKLYFAKGACSLAVRIILNETGMAAEYEAVDLRSKKTKTGRNYLEINPKGAVPALELDNGEVLTESAIVLQYIADTARATELLPPTGDFARYRVLEWVNYITTELHKSFGLLFNPSIPGEFKDQTLIPILKFKLNYVNQQLQNKKYLLDDHFTLPDAYLFVMLRWATYFEIDFSEWENLTRYFAALKNRPSIEQSLAQENA